MKKQPNSWLVFVSLAAQIGVLMYLALRFAAYADRVGWISNPWSTLGSSTLAMFVIIKLIMNQTRNL